MLDSDLACFGFAGLLVVVGTLASGLLPSALPYQVLAGAIIVSGFAVPVLCFRDDLMPE